MCIFQNLQKKINAVREAGIIPPLFFDVLYPYMLSMNSVTIPEWLNKAALEKNINFSQTLQEALIAKLKG